jgi:hypothetical protein
LRFLYHNQAIRSSPISQSEAQKSTDFTECCINMSPPETGPKTC